MSSNVFIVSLSLADLCIRRNSFFHKIFSESHFSFIPIKIDRLSLTSALYLKNDSFEKSDDVFGVKDTPVVELGRVTEGNHAQQYSYKQGARL